MVGPVRLVADAVPARVLIRDAGVASAVHPETAAGRADGQEGSVTPTAPLARMIRMVVVVAR